MKGFRINELKWNGDNNKGGIGEEEGREGGMIERKIEREDKEELRRIGVDGDEEKEGIKKCELRIKEREVNVERLDEMMEKDFLGKRKEGLRVSIEEKDDIEVCIREIGEIEVRWKEDGIGDCDEGEEFIKMELEVKKDRKWLIIGIFENGEDKEWEGRMKKGIVGKGDLIIRIKRMMKSKKKIGELEDEKKVLDKDKMKVEVDEGKRDWINEKLMKMGLEDVKVILDKNMEKNIEKKEIEGKRIIERKLEKLRDMIGKYFSFEKDKKIIKEMIKWIELEVIGKKE